MTGQTWIIASGKGGVGKTTLAACLAIGLAMNGERVAVIDTDIGLRDMDTILCLENNIVFNICDVADKECKLFDALVIHPDYPGLALLPAAQFRRVKDIDNDDLAKIVAKLKSRFSSIIIDCPAGIERGLSNTLNTADEIILVTTPDMLAIRDVEQTAYFFQKKHQPRPWLIINQMVPALVKSGDMYTSHTIAHILDLELLGAVPKDELLYRAVLTHISPMISNVDAHQAIMRIVHRIQGHHTPVPADGVIKHSLWSKLFKSRGDVLSNDK
jgi:septum site-determining protein MinD